MAAMGPPRTGGAALRQPVLGIVATVGIVVIAWLVILVLGTDLFMG